MCRRSPISSASSAWRARRYSSLSFGKRMWLSLISSAVGTRFIGRSPGGQSVAIGCAEREQRAVRARLVDGSRERRSRQQALAVGDHAGERRIDPVCPVGVEQERCGAAIGKTEAVGGHPGTAVQPLVEPCVRGIELLTRPGDPVRVALVLRAQAVEHDALQRRGDVVVEESIQRAHLERGARVGGQQRYRARMLEAEVLDDDAGLDDGAAGVDQYRHALQRPQRRPVLLDPRVIRRQQAPLERRPVLVQCDQYLLGVGREGMGVQGQAVRLLLAGWHDDSRWWGVGTARRTVVSFSDEWVWAKSTAVLKWSRAVRGKPVSWRRRPAGRTVLCRIWLPTRWRRRFCCRGVWASLRRLAFPNRKSVIPSMHNTGQGDMQFAFPPRACDFRPGCRQARMRSIRQQNAWRSLHEGISGTGA